MNNALSDLVDQKRNLKVPSMLNSNNQDVEMHDDEHFRNDHLFEFPRPLQF